MKKFLFYLIQFTWGLPQNLVGLIGYLVLYKKSRHERFHNAFITLIDSDKPFGGISLGVFIFVNGKKSDDWLHDTRIHEFGHTIQSLVLGPLYFLVIGFPSFLWCNLPPVCRYRKEHDVSYYTIYCEGWANLWGSRFSGQAFITDEVLQRGRFGKPINRE